MFRLLPRSFKSFQPVQPSLLGRASPALAGLHSAPWDPDVKKLTILPRTLPSCLPLVPHRSQHQQQATPTEKNTPKSYTEIPKAKTFLGVNVSMLQRQFQIDRYLYEQVTELGSLFRLAGIPGMPEMLCVSHPQDVEAVFRAGDVHYPERFPLVEWRQARKELDRPRALFLEEGENWARQRIPISKFILMPRKMSEYFEPFNHVVGDYISLIRDQRTEDNLLVDIVNSLNRWSLESVSLFVLGKRLGCLEQMPADIKELVHQVHVNLETTNKLLFGGLPLHKLWRTKTWKAMVSAQDHMLSFAGNLVEEKIKALEAISAELEAGETHAELGEDFITYMAHSGKMSVQEIAANAIDLLLAGVDTTSLTMAGCLYALGCNPEVQEKLRAEVRGVVGDEPLVSPKHIQDMHYLRDTIKESMRLFPIVPNNSRILNEDVVLSGYEVPAGTLTLIPTIVNGRLPELFPEPDKFKPERWSRDNAQMPNSFSSLPFGFGRRMCVGRRVAELEMHILLAQMMRNFKVEFRDEKPLDFCVELFYRPARRLDLALVDLN